MFNKLFLSLGLIVGLTTSALSQGLVPSISQVIAPISSSGGGGSGTVTSLSNSDGTITIGASNPCTTACTVSLNLGNANTWTALQKYTLADFALLGSSTGYTLLESGLGGSSNNTLILPTETSDTLVDLTGTQTLTNKTISFSSNTLTGVAPLASPAFTLIPTAPTAAANTNTTQLATTAFVIAQGYGTGNCSVSTTAGIVSGNGSSACTVDSNATLSAGALSLGASGTAGSTIFGNATSGTITLSPVTGALGTVTASLPANTGTLAEINLPQTWSAAQSINSGDLSLKGATSGTIILNAAATAGSNTMTIPATTSTLACLACAESFSANQTMGSSITFEAPDGSTWTSTGLTMGASITMGANSITGINNAASSAAGGYELFGGSCITSATTFCIAPDRAQDAGIGTHGVAGDVNIITGTSSAAEQMYWGSGTWFAPGLTAGSSAQTGDVCYGSSNQLFLESVSCLVSLEDDKNIKGYISPFIALNEVMKLKPFYFTFNQKKHPTTDTELQDGLGARNTNKVDSRLTFSDHGKLQGIRDKAIEAILVAAIQEQQKEISTLKQEVNQLKYHKGD